MLFKSPKATVGAVIYNSKIGRHCILLTKRNIEPFKNYWCLPGGHVEENEPILQAVIREVKEETNLDFTPEFLNYFEEIFPDQKIHNVALFFYGPSNGTPIPEESEVSDMDWFLLKDALKLDLAFRHAEVLKFYKSKIQL
jgi:8-oxo-dGTP diphosphatase